MKTETLNYDLPFELIAQRPAARRSESRLLALNRSGGCISDNHFADLTKFLCKGDCLVLNNTKVLPARFYGNRATGGKIEGLYLREQSAGNWLVMLKGVRKLKDGERFVLRDSRKEDFCTAKLVERQGQGRCVIEVESDSDAQGVLERIGFPPLPPYIRRDDDPETAVEDKQRYQTVYASQSGAVAAPTAGLHFTEKLLEQLREMGVLTAEVTLHVGAGTFKPVKAEELENHEIHEERFSIDAENARIVNEAKRGGGRIVAVGTTSVRTLESVARDGRIEARSGTTQLFIRPGYEFKIVDAIVTNFHLPKSTLLALVAAFAGLENVMAAYKYAIEQRYRFYSYGDAMLIL